MYVITGATGNTGGGIAKHLLAKGQKVRAIGRNIDRLQSLTALGAEPFVANVTDARALTEAFAGARAVYVMLPPNQASDDVRGYQDRVVNAVAAALESTRVPHAVSLSSIGADKNAGTGPVVGVHLMEERLNRISGLNALHFRAGYFMENTLVQAGIIQQMGITAGPLSLELKLPMIATRDIASAATEALLQLDFTGHQTRELLGQRDLSMAEATAIIGAAIGKPDLAYIQVSGDQFRGAMTQMGASTDMANLILEMAAALNSGHMKALEARSARNTTPTAFETFINEEFLPRYKGGAQEE